MICHSDRAMIPMIQVVVITAHQTKLG